MTMQHSEEGESHICRAGAALGVALLAALVVDLAGLVKPCILSAASFTRILFRPAMDETQFVDSALRTIIHDSASNDIPSLLVAAIAVDHRRLRALLLEANSNISHETRELRSLEESSPVGANALLSPLPPFTRSGT